MLLLKYLVVFLCNYHTKKGFSIQSFLRVCLRAGSLTSCCTPNPLRKDCIKGLKGNQAKPHTIVSNTRRIAVAIGTAATPGITAPAAPANHTGRACARAGLVGYMARGVISIPVLTPFIYISMHVILPVVPALAAYSHWASVGRWYL